MFSGGKPFLISSIVLLLTKTLCMHPVSTFQQYTRKKRFLPRIFNRRYSHYMVHRLSRDSHFILDEKGRFKSLFMLRNGAYKASKIHKSGQKVRLRVLGKKWVINVLHFFSRNILSELTWHVRSVSFLSLILVYILEFKF